MRLPEQVLSSLSRKRLNYIRSEEKLPADYVEVPGDIKERIRSKRLRVTLAANAAIVLLYWDIGKVIPDRQKKEGWGAKIIDRLSHDLKSAFPDMTGLSPRNLKYMHTFSESWPDSGLVQRTVALIPWRSNITLPDKLKDPEIRIWYAHKKTSKNVSSELQPGPSKTQGLSTAPCFVAASIIARASNFPCNTHRHLRSLHRRGGAVAVNTYEFIGAGFVYKWIER